MIRAKSGRVGLSVLGLSLLVVFGYFLAWPVSTAPVVFEPPPPPPNLPEDRHLAALQLMPLGPGRSGPEDIAVGPDGLVYATTREGEVVRFEVGGKGPVESWVDTGGGPLGLVFDREGRLLVADPYKGLLRVNAAREIEVLVPARSPDTPNDLCFTNNVDVGLDGVIYFTDATSRFCPADHGGTFEASVLDVMEHQATGRLLAFNPNDGTLRTLMDDLQFANGVATSEDGKDLLVVETGQRRVWRYSIEDESRTLIREGMAGYPDNITRGREGRFWLGFAKPTSALVEGLAGSPFVRQMIIRLPRAFYPIPPPFGHIVALNIEGTVLERYQDPDPKYSETTGAIEAPGGLYVSSLTSPAVGFLPRPTSSTATNLPTVFSAPPPAPAPLPPRATDPTLVE